MSPPADHALTAFPRAKVSPFRRAPRWPLGFALVLVAAGIWEIAAHQLQHRGVPTRANWTAADRFVRKHHQPGDLIVTAPSWADPLGRLMLGDRMTLDDVTRPDARTYGRIWELSIRGARHPDTRGLRHTQRRTFGGVTATLYVQTPVKVVTDFYEQIAKAGVWEERKGSKRHCPWQPARLRHDCGPNWKSVRQIRAEIGYAPRRCLLAMPIEGSTRVIEYPAARLGKRLVVWTGLRGYDPRYRARRAVWDYQRYRAGKRHKGRPPRPVTSVPVTLEVLVDGRVLGRVAHPIEDEGWRRQVLTVPASSSHKAVVVQLRIHTRYAWSKHFCFYARSEEGAP
jgi:hypothetical protein